jgi:CrcB protein
VRRPQFLALIAAFVGGLLGTTLRLGLDTLLPHAMAGSMVGVTDRRFASYVALSEVTVAGASIAWSTVVVNLVGALALGYLVARLWRLPSTPAWLKVGLGTGLLGSFTTFSAITVNVVDALTLGNIGVALAALGVSVVGGIAAAWAGLLLGGWHAGVSRIARTRRLLDAIPDAGLPAIPDAGLDAGSDEQRPADLGVGSDEQRPARNPPGAIVDEGVDQ